MIYKLIDMEVWYRDTSTNELVNFQVEEDGSVECRYPNGTVIKLDSRRRADLCECVARLDYLLRDGAGLCNYKEGPIQSGYAAGNKGSAGLSVKDIPDEK